MSQSYVKLTPILVEDPITKVNDVDKYAVVAGGSRISFKAWPSTSISSSSIIWSAPPPSAGVIVNRNVKTTLPVRLTFTGTVSTNNAGFVPATSLLNAGLDALRFMPIQSMMETLNIGINNTSVSIPMSDLVHPLTRYNICPELRRREYSQSPSYPDCSFNYQDLVGTARNPLGSYGNSADGDEIPRGGYPITIVSNATVVPTTGAGTAATAIVDCVLTESLMLSPLFWGASSQNTQGFFNVNSFDVTMTFLAQAGFRAWSHANTVTQVGANAVTSTITGITVQFNNFSGPAFSYGNIQPLLLFEYITPSVLTKQQIGVNIPLTYPYFNIQRYPTDIPPITFAQGSTQINSQSIQLSSIPRQVYIYVRPNNQTLQSRADITDCYLAILNMQIQWANQSVLLSSASQQQLFAMNVRNNGSANWIEWSGLGVYNGAFPPNALSAQYGGTGAIMCLRFGTDIQLEPDEAPGVGQNQYMLQVTMNVQNMNSSTAWDALPLTMYIVTISEGTFTIPSLGSAETQLGVLSKTDVLDATSRPGLNYNRVASVNGGDFLSSLGSFASKVNDFLRENKIISSVVGLIPHPIAQAISTGAKVLGYGEGGCDGGVAIQGGMAVQGGARLNKAHLQARLGAGG
jgi:hypothetical protein